MNKPIVKLERGEHRKAAVVFIRFEYNETVISRVKLLGARFTKTNKCWYMPVGEFNYEAFTEALNGDAIIEIPANKPKQEEKQTFSKKVTFEVNAKEHLIYILFYFDSRVVEAIKGIKGAWYHVGAKIWSVPNTDEHLEQINMIFSSNAYKISVGKITHSYAKTKTFKKKPETNLIPEHYSRQLKLENKSKRTIEIYESFINQFLNAFEGIEPKDIPMERIRGYILHHREHLHYSESYQNQLISSLKSFYRIMYKTILAYEEIPRPKKSRSLPRVLSKQEVERIINTPSNIKHRLILALLYGCGLRLNELVCLQVNDFNFNNNTLMIIRGKGSKDRRVPIPKAILPLLHRYIKSYLPENYLLYGQNQIQYSGSSIQKLVREYSRKAGIEKHVTPHTLRHCYATHMLEKGVDLRYIQELLGHRSSKTTEIYTHVTNRKLGELGNPLDDISF